MKKIIFSDFLEYWKYARCLSENQRGIVFSSLSTEQKEIINQSFCSHGWIDVFRANAIDTVIDEFKKDYNINLIELKSKVLKGKSVYFPKKLWIAAQEALKEYRDGNRMAVLGGIKAYSCNENENVVLLLPENLEANR